MHKIKRNFSLQLFTVMGRLYEINIAAENDDGIGVNATEWLTTPVGIPEAEPLNVRYELNADQVTDVYCILLQVYL